MMVLPAIGGLAILAGGIFFLSSQRGQNDFRTFLYLALSALWSLMLGIAVWYLRDADLMPLQDSFVAVALLVTGTGTFHLWWMYDKLFWARRNPFVWADDSFLLEMLFTLLTAALVSGCIVAVLAFFGEWAVAEIIWPTGLFFLIPFLFLKSRDFLSQVPPREYRVKWEFSPRRINEADWPWHNETWVYFEARETWHKPGMNRPAKFRILAPRHVPLGEVFRLGARQYNYKGPQVVLQDLGFEPENAGAFWWLFSLKFIWDRPHTWLPASRLLNPMLSPLQNGLRPHDVVLARRVLFGNQQQRVAIGEY